MKKVSMLDREQTGKLADSLWIQFYNEIIYDFKVTSKKVLPDHQVQQYIVASNWFYFDEVEEIQANSNSQFQPELTVNDCLPMIELVNQW